MIVGDLVEAEFVEVFEVLFDGVLGFIGVEGYLVFGSYDRVVGFECFVRVGGEFA